MPRRIYLFDPPDRFVAGTVGEPGQRTFFLQAGKSGRLVSVALEKVQVAVLTQRLTDLLDEAGRLGVGPADETAPAMPDVAPLDEPIIEAFRVGTMTLTWDGEAGLVTVEARAVVDQDEDDDDADEDGLDEEEAIDDAADGPDVFRVRIAAGEARAFVQRATRIVAAGRPPCPLCGLPLNPEGHICPRRNGYVN